jgi:hypothetical protein
MVMIKILGQDFLPAEKPIYLKRILELMMNTDEIFFELEGEFPIPGGVADFTGTYSLEEVDLQLRRAFPELYVEES